MLYKSYLKTRDINKADFYFEKHLSSLKGQMDINNAINSNFKKIETDGYLEEMKILKNENTKQRVIFLIGFIAAIIMLFFIVLGFKGNQKRNQEKLKIPIDQISIQEKRHQPKVDVLKINDTEIQRIIQNLNELEDKGYFLRVDCTVSNLAKKLKTNTTYLSKIVNVHYQKNFTTYINDQRIDYVRERLKKDPMFRRYSIVSIANEIGFKSKESFNSAFKKRTGVLPSVVIKELNKTLNS
jgi:AraC-like DNA-binding protein